MEVGWENGDNKGLGEGGRGPRGWKDRGDGTWWGGVGKKGGGFPLKLFSFIFAL